MHWADIQAAIYKAKSSLTKIANEEDVSVNMVSMVTKGERTSAAVANAIAAKTGLTTQQMWPDKYPPNPKCKPVQKSTKAVRQAA